VNLAVKCEPKNRDPFDGIVRDISIGGMFIESTESAPPFGTDITIVGDVPGLSGSARLPAVVRWVKPGGFGVQFGLLGARETHAIAKLLKA